MEVHPVADLFPMLADDELAELAADIKARGQLQPIVLDTDGRIIDGRNRLAACELAEVKPEFVTYEGDDPDGYALAVNGQRRSMSKGQKALVAAELLLSNKDHKQDAVAASLGVSQSLVSQAVQITKWARDLRDQIMVTGSGFADARAVAAERQEAKQITESKKARLRTGAPDLLALVDEGRMDIDDATAALDAREEKALQEAATAAAKERALEAQRESERRVAATNLRSVLTYLTSASIPPDRLAEQQYGEIVHEFDQGDLDYAVETMTAIAQTKRNSNG
jgi:ParB/RepB/Spo0J family partition protein